jgi:cytoskeletal protein RodZ
MPTLGEELRRRREEQGITLAEISETTRIGTRFLKAIEDNNFSVLPGGIYTRNFIRSYAERVGMEGDEAITVYQQQMSGQTGDLPISSHDSVRVFPTERARSSETLGFRQPQSRTNWSTVVIAAGIVLIVLIIAISLFQRLGGSSSPEEEPQSSANSDQTPSTTPAGPATQPSTEPAPQPSQPQTAEAPDLSGDELIRVKLEATTDPSDIQFWIDDDPKASHLLISPGQTQELPPAKDQVRLSIGNRVALKMIINNREATFPSDTQKFRARITVTRENLDTFFPQQLQ